MDDTMINAFLDEITSMEKIANGDEAEGGRAPTKEEKRSITGFIKKPGVTDEKFHEWLEPRGLNPHKAEDVVYQHVRDLSKSAAKLTQARREGLSSKQFAVPTAKAKKLGVKGEIKGKAKGKYPIPDLAHARNALVRVSQHGTAGEKATVRAKVHSKFPGIGNDKQKEAKRDMPPFLEQDRPEKVKEIYSALKREHPNMPAEMKARIAARKGKGSPKSRKPPETGGPEYKAPLHYVHKGGEKWKKASVDSFLSVLFTPRG